MAGCWTCRMRKKKCNQALPSCSECLRLGIQCDGYGTRPSWADGGVQEAKYKRQLKDHIRCKAKLRRHNSLQQAPELTSSMAGFGETGIEDVHVFDDGFVDFLVGSPIFVSDLDAPTINTSGFYSNCTSLSSQSSDHPSPSCILTDEEFTMPNSYGQDLNDLSAVGRAEYHSFPDLKRDLDMGQCEALIHYLDHLFWMQFPMCSKTRSSVDRTWVLFYMSKSTIFKKAVIQLRTTAVERASHGIKITAGIKRSNFDLISDLREEAARATGKHSVRDETNIKQLLAAASLITYQVLMLASPESLDEVLSTTQDLVSNLREEGYDHDDTTSTQHVALTFSLRQAFHVDTLYAATRRSACILNDFQLQKSGLEPDPDTEGMYACSIWVLRIIRKVIHLDTWRSELSMQGRLSIPELVTRGRELLELLSSRAVARRSSSIASMAAINDRDIESSPATSYQPNFATASTSKEITDQLYIKAASIYVHVIVSGANPHLPEIQRLVESSLNLLQGLRSLDVFACVIWPLMVITCLASGEQRESCRFIMSQATQQEPLKKTYTVMLRVAQECWRLANDAPLLQWDWGVAIENLGLSNVTFILPT